MLYMVFNYDMKCDTIRNFTMYSISEEFMRQKPLTVSKNSSLL